MAASVAAPRPVLKRRVGRQEVINSVQQLGVPNSALQARAFAPFSLALAAVDLPGTLQLAQPPDLE